MTVTFHLESFNIVQVTSNSFPENVFDMLYKPKKVQGRKDLVWTFVFLTRSYMTLIFDMVHCTFFDERHSAGEVY